MSRDPLADFAGRWIVVTGASSGIGRATAIELSRRDARVVLVGRDEERLATTAAAVETEHRVLPLELADHDAIAPAILGLRDDIGRLSGLCHCAGIVTTRPLSASGAAVTGELLDVNVLAAIELCRAICRRDVFAAEGGAILLVSSVYGHIGAPGQVSYCTSKSALYGAARAMAVELARRRIRVNTISPGLVRTEMTERALALLTEEQVARLEAQHPLGTGAPEDVARAAAFLLSPAARWITGTDLTIDGGMSAH